MVYKSQWKKACSRNQESARKKTSDGFRLQKRKLGLKKEAKKWGNTEAWITGGPIRGDKTGKTKAGRGA